MTLVLSGMASLVAGACEVSYDPVIDSLVRQVSTDSGCFFIESLSGERSVIIAGISDSIPVRHALSSGIMKATNWLKEQFELRGIEVNVQQSTSDFAPMSASRPLPLGMSEEERARIFEYLNNSSEPFTCNNVVATIPGKDSKEVLLGAHYDATSEVIGTYTPGADDNASGCAAVLEAARIMSAYKWQHTLKFVLFSGEELGLLGSEYYVKTAVSKGEPILAALIMDMIAFNGDDVPQMDLHCCPWDERSQQMGDTLASMMGIYSSELEPDIHIADATDRSDHYWFWIKEIPSVLLIEDFDDFTPFYHTMQDRIGTLDTAFFHDAMRLVLAWASTEAGLIADTPLVVAENKPQIAGELSFDIPSRMVRNQISFNIRSENEVSLMVFDASGRRVMTLPSLPPSLDVRPVTADISGLSAGVYWLNANGGTKGATERFVVVR
jgi:hypothetical protein